jgi:hypothetical protein
VADADVPAHEKACRYLARAQDYAKQSAELTSNGNCRAIDGYFAATEAAWNAMWLCPDNPDLVREAAELYACSLQGLLESATAHGRLDCRGLLIGPEWGPIVVPIEMRGMQIPASAIEHVEATPPPGDKRIKRRHERGGFGLPVSVRVATPVAPSWRSVWSSGSYASGSYTTSLARTSQGRVGGGAGTASSSTPAAAAAAASSTT